MHAAGAGINDNPYINIGKQDITAHVNFSELDYFGSANGLQGCGFTLQSHFLHALGIAGYLRDHESNNKSNEKMFLLQKLLLSMGSRLKVMIQQKGMPMQRLAGMQFSQRMPA
jgi:SAM-dependent MidA family methyltransferase